MNRDDFTIWGDRPRFELDPYGPIAIREIMLSGKVPAIAAWPVNDSVVLRDMAIPRKILVHATVSDGAPRMVLGIEVRNNEPTCTYLELAAYDDQSVRAKHLKSIRIEDWVKEVVLECKDHVFTLEDDLSEPELSLKQRVRREPITREHAKAVEALQRRRRDPKSDQALLERVAALYREHPDAPNKAVALALNVSERTAARYAGYCSEVGLLPPTKQGVRRR